jgi:PAS domain S-box-containing protein
MILDRAQDEGAGPGPTSRARAPSLRRRVLGLTIALVCTVLGFAALAVFQVQRATEQQIATQLLGTARALALAIDGELSRAEALLRGLSRLPSLRTGDFPRFLLNARDAAEALGMPVISVAGPDGRQRINFTDPPERLAAGLPAAPEAMRVFETGRSEIGDYVAGSEPGTPRIVLAVPVRDGPDRPAILSLGVVVPRVRLTEVLAAQRFPEGWVAAVVDRRGTVVARSRAEERFVGQPATPDIRAALAERAEGVLASSRNLEGVSTVAAFARAPLSGYAVVIGAPETVFATSRWQALGSLATFGVPVAGAAILLALLLLRQVGAALRGLAEPHPDAPRLAEVDDLAEALSAERQLRNQVELRLRERNDWLEAAQQAAQVGVWETDYRRGVTRWSAGMLRILGRTPQEEAAMPAMDWTRVVHPEDLPRVLAAAEAATGQGAPAFHEQFRVRRADGSVRWVRSQGVTELAPDGAPLRMVGAWIDITERRRLEEARESAMRQHDLMASEIHHRIRNSLQLVLSLLLLQARRASPEAAQPLRDAATRVATIAQVHRRLYEAGPEAAGDAGAYLAGLAQDLHASLGDAARERELALALEPGVVLPPDQLPAIGIIATELITNALKYGAKTITLSLRRRDGQVEMAVQDGGSGFPGDFDPAQSRGLGMRVATTLARQAGGTLQVDRDAPGGRVVLAIPDPGRPEA